MPVQNVHSLSHHCRLRYLGICLLVGFLSACDSASSDKPPTLRLGFPARITSVDPAYATTLHQMWVVGQVYETLVEVDENLRIRPLLAVDWKVDSTYQKFVFYLRRGVYFHPDPCFGQDSTRMLTAEDVAFTLRRLASDTHPVPAGWLLRGRLARDSGIIVWDSFVVEVRLNRPFAPFLAMMGCPQAGILPREALSFYGDRIHRHAVGTGPFRLVHLNEMRVVLQKFEKYWNDTVPRLTQVVFERVLERQNELQLLMTGTLDWISGPPPVVVTSLLTPEGEIRPTYRGHLVVRRFPYLNVEYIGILVDSQALPPKWHVLLRKEVRQALNLVLDREAMLRAFRYGLGYPGTAGFVHPEMYRQVGIIPPQGYTRNVERARLLLQEAGIDLSEVPPVPLVVTPEYLDFAEYLANTWKEHLGFSVQIEVMDPSAAYERKQQKRAPLFRASWIADYPDLETFFLPWIARTSPPNSTGYFSPALQKLYDRAVQEPDPYRRAHLFRQMDSLLLQDAPFVILYYDEGLHVHRPDIQYFPVHPMNWLLLKYVNREKSSES